jgi:hypothetical protein
VFDSFTSNEWNSSDTNNTIIDAEIEYWRKYSSGIYPALSINNRSYRGQLESLAVFNALCAGFKDLPSVCTPNAANPTLGYVP